MFKLYRQAYIEMESDEEVQQIRGFIADLQDSLEEIEAPYRDRIADAKDAITNLVLEEGQSIARHGVRATYKNGRRITSWKSVASELSPSQDLIDQFTTVGKPSVKVKLEEIKW